VHVIDHTDPGWEARYVRKGRENGAATYSRDIVRHHLPVLRELLPPGSVVSTCPLLVEQDVAGPVAVQYLHTYSYRDALRQPRLVADHLAGRVGRLVFVTAYRALHARLTAAGFEAVFVPMAVDADAVRAHRSAEEQHEPRRAVYFGNLTRPKRRLFERLRGELTAQGWTLDLLSEGWLEGRWLRQTEAWREVSRYRFGIGVGRCALEMMALGLRVMVAGAEFGGLATTPDEHAVQAGCNYNGRVTTFDRDIGACVDAWTLATASAGSVEDAVGVLRTGLGMLRK
jgi:hypothetical protein